MSEDEFLKNVYGNYEIKKELKVIHDWFIDPDIYNNKDVNIPKGILFYGEAGCGKTLIIREYIKEFDYPHYILNGSDNNILKEISTIFKKARKDIGAIIAIDELDSLMAGGKKEEINRLLKSELDGIDKSGHILVLLAANYITLIPAELRRNGRIDRTFCFSRLDSEKTNYFLNKYLDEFCVDKTNIDLDILSNLLSGKNPVILRNIINDAYLRNGKKLSNQDINKSMDMIANNSFSDPTKYKDKRVAIHEAGHILMSLKAKDTAMFYKSYFDDCGGVTIANSKIERNSIEGGLDKIRISLGGLNAEKIIFGFKDVGSYRDLFSAHEECIGLISRTCIYKLDDFKSGSPNSSDIDLVDFKFNRRIRKKTAILLNKLSKQTYRYLKKHKSELCFLADILYKKGSIDYKDIPENWNI